MIRHGWEQHGWPRRYVGALDERPPKARIRWRDSASGNAMMRLCWSLAKAEEEASALRLMGHDDVRIERMDDAGLAA